MAKGFTFELNRRGVSALLRSTEAAQAVSEAAERVASAAGSGYTVETKSGRTRVHARVKPSTKAAVSDNYKNNTLLKALKSAKR